MSNTDLISSERIEKVIYLIRSEKVMLDRDLALLYEVETKVLNRAVKRNLQRFPSDFMFQLTAEEADSLRCQIGTSKKGRGGRRSGSILMPTIAAARLITGHVQPQGLLPSVPTILLCFRFNDLRFCLAATSGGCYFHEGSPEVNKLLRAGFRAYLLLIHFANYSVRKAIG
jgi:hypothetical protein